MMSSSSSSWKRKAQSRRRIERGNARVFSSTRRGKSDRRGREESRFFDGTGDEQFGGPGNSFPSTTAARDDDRTLLIYHSREKKEVSGFDRSALRDAEKDAPIITHCGGGGRGQKSKEWLEKKGFTNVINGGGPQVTELWEMFGGCNIFKGTISTMSRYVPFVLDDTHPLSLSLSLSLFL